MRLLGRPSIPPEDEISNRLLLLEMAIAAVLIHPVITSVWRVAWERGQCALQQESTTAAQREMKRLGDFISHEVEGEPSRPEGVVDTAIRLIQAKSEG